MLFICGGAFAGLDKVIRDRTEKSSIGFSAAVATRDDSKNTGDVIKNVETEDLVKYGLIPEFVGRLPVVATLNELDEDALVQILTEPKNSLTKQYQKLFDMEGVELDFLERKTGARGLRSIMEATLLDTMYQIPSEHDISKVVIDESVILGDSEPFKIYANTDHAKAVPDD